MEGLSSVDDAVESRFEAKIKRGQELKDLEKNQRKELCELRSKSVDQVETLLRDKLEPFSNNTENLSAEIVADGKIIEEKREEVIRIKSHQVDSEKRRIQELKSFVNGISTAVPKFRDALTVYSKNNLDKEINEIRLESRKVRKEIAEVDHKIEILASKYDLDVLSLTMTVPGNEIVELQNFKAILTGSKSDKLLARKRNELFDKKLEEKIERNKRVIASYVYTE